MNEWQILTPLSTVKVGIKLWMLTRAMKFNTPEGKFKVPVGFLFDHASVPRIFTRIVPPVKSAIAEASVLHDWFYNKESKDVPRKFADECLKELTRVRGGSKALCFNAHTAVRLGGGGLYNKIYFEEKMVDVYPEHKGLTAKELKLKILRR